MQVFFTVVFVDFHIISLFYIVHTAQKRSGFERRNPKNKGVGETVLLLRLYFWKKYTNPSPNGAYLLAESKFFICLHSIRKAVFRRKQQPVILLLFKFRKNLSETFEIVTFYSNLCYIIKFKYCLRM